MQIPILIEPAAGGRFRAKAGEPFSLSAEGASAEEAARHLASLLHDRLQAGTCLSVIDLGNGPASLPPTSLCLEPLPDDDWFFQAMRDAITENRQHEDGAQA